jgi:hypothetical protein
VAVEHTTNPVKSTTMMSIFVTSLLLTLTLVSRVCESFSPPLELRTITASFDESYIFSQRRVAIHTETRSLTLLARTDKNDDAISRRSFGFSVSRFAGVSGITMAISVRAAVAATKVSEEEVAKEKISKGYQRLTYLLDNWVEETTICGRSGDNPYISAKGCERTPLKVMDYLGYRDINDPLFRADKTMKKLEPLIPIDRFGDYLDAIEKWSEAAEEGNGMAFISSWGEANPGGGKDRVALFIERAKKNVVDSRDSLAVIIDILGIK